MQIIAIAISACIVTVIVVLAAMSVRAGAESAKTSYGYCKYPLNVREEMSIESKWISQYPAGGTIILLEDLGEWYRVGDGYVMKEYVFDEVEIYEKGIVKGISMMYAEPSFTSAGSSATGEHMFVAKKNGFAKVDGAGWIPETNISFDIPIVVQEDVILLTLDDMYTGNMINLPIQYMGTLEKKTRGTGVTRGGGLNFVGQIPIYDIIDEYAYFPSGKHIYKIKASSFITLENVGSENVILDAYRTVYHSSGASRRHNIELVSAFLDGQIIESGATFSYNNTTGPRSKANGYQIAKVISRGEYVDGYGGGVCQVSSTIYAAVMNNPYITIVERRPHALESTYIPVGMDATVSYGSIDLQFINNYPFAIMLNVKSENGACLVTITRVETGE